ncbi:MAG: 50S ribosomal protein L5 [Candidatus Aenigmarchaeota archaeon]|nr:50S ribosomal protein L5 [Candidatus Aenigmarchaeota archaeon]
MNKSNKMREIRVEKVTLNIGCGTKLNPETAKVILERISGAKAVITKTHKRSTFGVAKNRPIGSKTTIRKGSEQLLQRLLEAKERNLPRASFDATGNVSFGVREYIEIPNMDYDPKLGVMGLDVSITLERPGYRVKKRKTGSRIGKNHVITREEAMQFMQEKFGVKVE